MLFGNWSEHFVLIFSVHNVSLKTAKLACVNFRAAKNISYILNKPRRQKTKPNHTRNGMICILAVESSRNEYNSCDLARL